VIIQVVSDSIDVEYPINKDISKIDVDISKLKVGDNIHLKNIVLPEYIILHDDPDKILVTISEASLAKHAEAEAQKTTETTTIETPVVEKE